MSPAGAAHRAVKRELLVRFLDSAVPVLLHGARFTYAEGYAVAHHGGEPSAVAALRVLSEFTDRLRGRRVTVVLVGADPDASGLLDRVTAVRDELGLPAQVGIDVAAGGCDEALLPALRQAGAFGAPIIAYLDAAGAGPPGRGTSAGLAGQGTSAGPAGEGTSAGPGYDTVAALAAGRRADVLIALDPATLARGEHLFGPTPGASGAGGDADQRKADRRYADLVTRYREALRRIGLSQVTHAELVDGSGYAQLIFFATASDRSFDHFKDALWAVDEFAGVRYRDPRDPEHTLLDISLDPHLGPLRRALLERVRGGGERPAAELRDYTRAETMYRAEDAFPALAGLISAGRLERQPQRGRLTPSTVVRAC
jgi:hypothetical protein